MSDKKNTLFPLVLAALCFCILFPACKSGMDDMLDDYNSHYTPTEDVPEVPGPGDIDFCSIEMLSDLYAIGDNESLNLFGPPKCKEYKWEVIDPFLIPEPDCVQVIYPEGFNDTSRRFLIYVPSSGLLRGVYQIKLTVVGENEETYSDMCKLIIYPHTN